MEAEGDNLRETSEERGQQRKVAMDVDGPKLRTDPVEARNKGTKLRGDNGIEDSALVVEHAGIVRCFFASRAEDVGRLQAEQARLGRPGRRSF